MDFPPAAQVGLRRALYTEDAQDLPVQTLFVVGQRHFIDRAAVQALDHRAFPHIAEQGDLALLVGRNFPFGAAKQNIGLNADGAQLLH